MSNEADLQRVLPAWLELTSRTDVSLGLDPTEAFRRAERLLNDLRSGESSAEGWEPEADQVEVLHAIVAFVCRGEAADPKAALREIELVFNFISSLPWPPNELGGPRELLSTCTFQGWRTASPFAPHPEVAKWVSRVRRTSDAETGAEQVLSVQLADREAQAEELGLSDPELLLCLCEILRARVETDPLVVHDEAAFFYRFIEQPARTIGLNDERDYFLGEFALTTASANRFLFKIDEAKAWLQTAEAHFALVQNANAHWARIAYQRLVVAVEERRFEEVLRLAPLWADSFRRLEMPEDAIKCRFLEGAVCWELGNADDAIKIHESIRADARAIGSTRLVAQAASNLTRYYGTQGQTEEALKCAGEARTLLEQLGSRVHLVKLHWSIGELLRREGKDAPALEAYRQAQSEARELGLRGDLAALHLVVADLLLEAGQEAQAEWEIRAAMPIIEEEKMVPEGIAALSLLRESLRRRQIDKRALRDLHGYFRES